jgi:hypothetical protein
MLGLGSLTFIYPWILIGLIVLPVLWWLMRFLPPRPRYIKFPAISFLFGLDKQQKTPAQTPWWLLLLRLAIAALLVIGLAQPVLKERELFQQNGPVVIIVENDWATTKFWNTYRQQINDVLTEAEQQKKQVLLIAGANIQETTAVASLMTANEAKVLFNSLQPQSWFIDRKLIQNHLDQYQFDKLADVFWYSNGLVDVTETSQNTDSLLDFVNTLHKLGHIHSYNVPANLLPIIIQKVSITADGMEFFFSRLSPDSLSAITLVGYDIQGAILFSEDISFADQNHVSKIIQLPSELRNRLSRVSIVGQSNAASVFLIDDQSKIKPVGILSGGFASVTQPLLSSTYYVYKALQPYSEIREGQDLEKLLERKLSLLILIDVGRLNPGDEQLLTNWVQDGGTLLRFAGPRLAQNSDKLLPIRIREGDRSFGGTLSWSSPARLAAFPSSSPFQGLVIPEDVVVLRQVLAEPDNQLSQKTWARLEDGTPLITQTTLGKGRLILVHTTANPDWSNFALSGLFVQILEKILDLSTGIGGIAISSETLPPKQILDAWGNLTLPNSQSIAASPSVFEKAAVSWQNPPGFYGNQTAQRALNLGKAIKQYSSLPEISGLKTEELSTQPLNIDFKPHILSLVCLLFLLDLLITLAILRPSNNIIRKTVLYLVAVSFAITYVSEKVFAQTSGNQNTTLDRAIVELTKTTRLAYIKTGVFEVDRTSQRGLATLSAVVNNRTSVVLGEPVGIDLERDDISLYPMLYWPVVLEQTIPSENARRRLKQYMRTGGMIVFDTRDQGVTAIGETPAQQRLQELAKGLDIPALRMIPKDHVLGRTFYLLQEYPGRWRNQSLWVERDENLANDGVSSIVIGGADWVAAWAYDENGRPMYRVVPGGDKQREIAFRFGINLVLYTLTGQYKADQIHVPAILERLEKEEK